MRWGPIFAVLVLAGCANNQYSERYAERPPPDVRRYSPVIYADEDCPPPQAIAAYCGSMRGRDACLAESQCAWVGGECRGIACRVPARHRYYY